MKNMTYNKKMWERVHPQIIIVHFPLPIIGRGNFLDFNICKC